MRQPLPLHLWAEKDLAAAVAELARLGGFARYHTYRSKRSPAGFPDEVLVKPPRVIFAELKTESGKPTRDQQAWLDKLRECPAVEVYVWRPSDLDDIALILTGKQARRAA